MGYGSNSRMGRGSSFRLSRDSVNLIDRTEKKKKFFCVCGLGAWGGGLVLDESDSSVLYSIENVLKSKGHSVQSKGPEG